MHDPEVALEASEAGEIYSETAMYYVEAIGSEISHAIDGPDECAALDAFALRCTEARFTDGPSSGGRSGGRERGPVADVGCGPGRAAAYLAARGVDVVGFDIAPGMIAAARTVHPGIPFELGTLTALPVEDHTLGGAVCWYSIIHTPMDKLAPVWAELQRALRPAAPLLLAFQAGIGERLERPGAQNSSRTLVNFRHEPERIVAGLAAAGFEIESIHKRPAVKAASHETTPQAMVLAQSAIR